MTRRVRFTALLAGGVFAVCLQARANEVPFVAEPIVGTGGVSRMTFGDVDRDGDLDVVQNDADADRVAWLENAAGDGSTWITRTISTVPDFPQALAVADLDRDGDLDVAVSSWNDSSIRWFENASGGANWVLHTVLAASNVRSLVAADVDRDGDQDLALATGSQTNERVAWLQNVTGIGTIWAEHVVSTHAAPTTVVTGDLDRDGDVDLASVGFWHENLGAGSSWSSHELALGELVEPVDLDRDGDLDLVSASSASQAVQWLENRGHAISWALRTIGVTEDRITWVDAADVDGDGDPDVAFGQGLLSPTTHRVRWFDNAGDAASWQLRTITSLVDSPRAVVVADLDRDGDADVLSTGANAALAWFRNQTLHGNACFVRRPMLGPAHGFAPGDIDGDGDLDIVTSLNATATWLENVGNGVAWMPHWIAAGHNFRFATGDLDGDGDVDVVGLAGNSLRLYDNTSGDGSAWTPHTIALPGSNANFLGLADLSRDGDPDLVVAGGSFDPVLLFENGGDGVTWTQSAIPGLTRQGAVLIADIDGDGDLDLTSAGAYSMQPLRWSENVNGDASWWSQHVIDPVFYNTADEFAAADIDRDGDLDVFTPSRPHFPFGTVGAWHENLGGTGLAWAVHENVMSNGAHGQAADLDRDGDADLISMGQWVQLAWHENVVSDGTAWTTHAVGTQWVPINSAVPADVDRDGDVDLLQNVGNRDGWEDNQGGQASIIAGAKQSPLSVPSGALVPLFRFTVTHLGRPGEGPIELASLGLRFGYGNGLPGGTELNAVLDSLHIHLDSNGNGVFDPGVDVLVNGVDTLSPAKGVQRVSFADGDPLVAVQIGDPRVYFVVFQFAPDAPALADKLIVNLLQVGPPASVLEDRTFDIRLRLACPVDREAVLVVTGPNSFTIE